MKFDEAQELIIEEYIKAKTRFPEMCSPHDGYAVILEELDELWDAIKEDQYSTNLKEEAKQVGAMALRFLVDCC